MCEDCESGFCQAFVRVDKGRSPIRDSLVCLFVLPAYLFTDHLPAYFIIPLKESVFLLFSA